MSSFTVSRTLKVWYRALPGGGMLDVLLLTILFWIGVALALLRISLSLTPTSTTASQSGRSSHLTRCWPFWTGLVSAEP
jgi:hypothetical protein